MTINVESKLRVAANRCRETHEKCMLILTDAFLRERGWIKVHAAEALLDLGERTAVCNEFPTKKESWEGSSQLGLWRLNYACSEDQVEKQFWMACIEQYYTNENGPFRLNALESLCKLSFAAGGQTLQMISRDASESSQAIAPFALWALHLGGNRRSASLLGEMISSHDPAIRMLSAFALRWIRSDEQSALKALAERADLESPNSPAYPFILSSALSLNASAVSAENWKRELLLILTEGEGPARYEVCQALKNGFTKDDLHTLESILDHSETDVRIGAATAICHLFERSGF